MLNVGRLLGVVL